MSHHHPRFAEAWDWDDPDEEGNVTELAAHGITEVEAEQVFENGPVWVRNKKEGSGDYKMVGLTHGGRALTIVVRYKENRRWNRPITGWEATKGERARYLGD